tara:strand:- start:1872 stop:2417 length:546 start_codon:yes stop_codon:yes gene_type:complete
MAVAGPAFALDNDGATRLVGQLVSEINRATNSGNSQAKLIAAFEKIFEQYADVKIISRSALGPTARTASAEELDAFSRVFRGYLARKYGKRFQEYIGSAIVVKSTRNRGKFFEVGASVQVKGSEPFEVSFRVSDRSGRKLFFDIIIEGISLLSSERVEMGALLDERNGDIGQLTNDLASLG